MKTFFRLSLLLVFPAFLFLPGCVPVVNNVHSAAEVVGQKIVAGRLVFYENDEVTDKTIQVYFTREGAAQDLGGCRRLLPDQDGYFYVALPAGQYNVSHIFYSSLHGSYVFDLCLDPSLMPQLVVRPEDAVVNFGTLEIRFSQASRDKYSQIFVGVGGAAIKVIARPDQEETRKRLTELVGSFAGPITDRAVQFSKKSP